MKRIFGRERNMLRVGTERRWPLVGFHHYREVAPIVQYQLVQKKADLIEVRLVSEKPVSKEQEIKLAGVIQQALGFKPNIQFIYFESAIPRGANGKFEEFVCEITHEK